jgi:hypothetical protein
LRPAAERYACVAKRARSASGDTAASAGTVQEMEDAAENDGK